MARIAWTFSDPTLVTPVEVIWEINPKDAPSYSVQKNIIDQSNQRDSFLLLEAGDSPALMTVSGLFRSESQYDFMVEWYNKAYPVNLTDDLDRTLSVYITAFAPTRVRRVTAPWKHEYSMTMLVVDWNVS